MNSVISTNRHKKIIIWCAILLVHLALLYAAFRPIHLNKMAEQASTLFLQIVRPPVAIPARLKEPEPARIPPAKHLQTQIKPQEVPAKTEEAPAPSSIAKNESDPFAMPTPQVGKLEQNDRGLGQIWKDLEKENPVRKNQFPKIVETPIQRFARQVLAASSAREVTMEESIRADGTKMTKVTTPHGVFCVVGPVAGRIHDIRGPEKRVMGCPIEF